MRIITLVIMLFMNIGCVEAFRLREEKPPCQYLPDCDFYASVYKAKEENRAQWDYWDSHYTFDNVIYVDLGGPQKPSK